MLGMFHGQKHRGDEQRSVPRSLRNMDHTQAVILPQRAAWGVGSENFPPIRAGKLYRTQISSARNGWLCRQQFPLAAGTECPAPQPPAGPARRTILGTFRSNAPPKKIPIRTHRTPADEITPPIPASVILLHFSLADSNRCLLDEVSPTRNRKFK